MLYNPHFFFSNNNHPLTAKLFKRKFSHFTALNDLKRDRNQFMNFTDKSIGIKMSFHQKRKILFEIRFICSADETEISMNSSDWANHYVKLLPKRKTNKKKENIVKSLSILWLYSRLFAINYVELFNCASIKCAAERQEEINGFRGKSTTAREIINIKILTLLKKLFHHPHDLVSETHLTTKKLCAAFRYRVRGCAHLKFPSLLSFNRA